MEKFKVTVTRTETVEVSRDVADKIIAAADASGLRADQIDVRCQLMLATPERRVLWCPDDSDYDHGDYENDAQRAHVQSLLETYGLWGYVCEQRNTVNGEWEHVDSCWGFTGNGTADILESMRWNMPDEFKGIRPIDQCDAEQRDREDALAIVRLDWSQKTA